MADFATVLTLARKHIGKGDRVSNARLCLADAIALHKVGEIKLAKQSAIKSIVLSIGVRHPDYDRATR
jgi:hypothetical protein